MAPHHRQRGHVAFAAAAICLQLVVHAAANPMLIDNIKPSKGQGTAKVASSSSYSGSSQSNLAVISAHVLRGCATLGCANCNETDEQPLSLFTRPTAFETGFVCPTHGRDSYGSGDSIFSAAAGGSVGSCLWTLDPYSSGLVDVKATQSSLLTRLGDVRATCSLSSMAEQCGVPGCEKVVLLLQGHAYGGSAWATTQGAGYIYDTSLEGEERTCCDLPNIIANEEAACSGRSPRPVRGIGPGTGFDNCVLGDRVSRLLPFVTSTRSSNPPGAGSSSKKKVQAAGVQNAAHTADMNRGGAKDEEFVFTGMAIIFSGIQTSYIVTKDGKEQIKDTGLFDFAFYTEFSAVTREELPATNLEDWLKVYPQQLRLSFTRDAFSAAGSSYSGKGYEGYEGREDATSGYWYPPHGQPAASAASSSANLS